jgi:hypothetical protein
MLDGMDDGRWLRRRIGRGGDSWGSRDRSRRVLNDQGRGRRRYVSIDQGATERQDHAGGKRAGYLEQAGRLHFNRLPYIRNV